MIPSRHRHTGSLSLPLFQALLALQFQNFARQNPAGSRGALWLGFNRSTPPPSRWALWLGLIPQELGRNRWTPWPASHSPVRSPRQPAAIPTLRTGKVTVERERTGDVVAVCPIYQLAKQDRVILELHFSAISSSPNGEITGKNAGRSQ